MSISNRYIYILQNIAPNDSIKAVLGMIDIIWYTNPMVTTESGMTSRTAYDGHLR